MTRSELYTLFNDQAQGVANTTVTDAIKDLYCRMVLGKISRFYNWNFALRETTISSPTSEVNLGSSLPDFKSMVAVWDPNTSSDGFPYEFDNLPSRDYILNISGYSYDVVAKTLKLSGGQGVSLPSSIKVLYYSRYLVLDNDGSTRKLTPDGDSDTFMIPDSWEDLLLDGMLMYLFRRERKWKEFNEMKAEFNQALTDLALKEPNTVEGALRAWAGMGGGSY